MQPLITAILEFIGKLITLGVVPKGWLTSSSSALQVIAGAGMLAHAANDLITTGTVPDQVTLGEAFGLVLLSNGAQGFGLGRKVESVLAAVKAAQTAVAEVTNKTSPPAQGPTGT